MKARSTTASLPRRIGALVLAVAGITACGLPTDEQVTTYNADELPDVLANTTTTSTTSTTVAPPPTDVAPDDPSSTTSTTVPPVETASVDVYFTLGFSDEMQRIILNLPSPVSLRQITSILESPPSEVTTFNLRSSLRTGLVGDVVLDRGTATVELSQDVLNRMTSSQERRSIAQLVLTLTSFVTPSEGAIGQVRFTVDGEPIPVFLPAVGGDSEPGEPVAYTDFDVLVTPAAPTTTTSTTTTSTPAPATTDGAEAA